MILNTLIRIPIWILFIALIIALIPIGLIPPETHSIVNRAMVLSVLFIWFFGVVAGQCRITWTVSTSLMAAFVMWASVTLLWARNVDTGTTVLLAYTARLLLFLLIIPSLIKSKTDFDGLMITLAFSGWVLILVSIGSGLFEGYTPGSRLKVFGANANSLGVIALLTLTGVLWQALGPSKQRLWAKKLMALMFLIMTTIVVVLSGSRGSAISLVIALLAFTLWKPTRAWGKLTLFVVLIIALSAPLMFETLLARFEMTLEGTPLGPRGNLWQGGWQLIRESPLLGVGIGNSGFEVQPLLKVHDPDGIALHNPILVVWSETGVVGLILYLGVLLSAVFSFCRQYQIYRRDGVQFIIPYFAIVGSVFLAYMASWIKGGGIENDISYFLMVALLLIPASLNMGIPGRPERLKASP